MAIAVEMFDDRHTRLGADAFNQAFAAAWHDDIDVLRHGEQPADRFTVSGINYLHGMFGQTSSCQPLADTGGDRLIGVKRL